MSDCENHTHTHTPCSGTRIFASKILPEPPILFLTIKELKLDLQEIPNHLKHPNSNTKYTLQAIICSNGSHFIGYLQRSGRWWQYDGMMVPELRLESEMRPNYFLDTVCYLIDQ